MKTHLRRLLPHAQVWLFGSRARGDASRRSDFDLAVEPGPHSGKEIEAFEEAILSDAEIIYPVDVVDLGALPTAARAKIMQECLPWTD
ncbi:MAG: nucleotidyltransferase domain-containing protein [Bdellovibrionaceae bacterium]|nr:nucleotidyltransferase domain-containing protein [Pseudobdellovibrionaceae bacterium]